MFDVRFAKSTHTFFSCFHLLFSPSSSSTLVTFPHYWFPLSSFYSQVNLHPHPPLTQLLHTFGQSINPPTNQGILTKYKRRIEQSQAKFFLFFFLPPQMFMVIHSYPSHRVTLYIFFFKSVCKVKMCCSQNDHERNHASFVTLWHWLVQCPL